MIYDLRTTVPAAADEAFAWHERPGALLRLNPPWEPVRLLSQQGGIRDGATVVLSIPLLGPLRIRWVARHLDHQAGRQFRDVQEKGPFASWDHRHRFEPDTARTSIMHDRIELSPPIGGFVGRLMEGSIRAKLARVFAYRHRTLGADLATHARWRGRPRQTVAISGATGLIGTALCGLLSTGGHRVIRLARPAPPAPPTPASHAEWPMIPWEPSTGLAGAAGRLDSVVHLAGVNVAARRWSRRFKAEIIASRVDATRALCRSLAKLAHPPATLVSASAVGFYDKRDTGAQDETSLGGDGFLADVCRAWEAATRPAEEAGIRVVHARIGIVLSPLGGALAKLLPLVSLGLGGPLGRGDQITSWVSLDDAIGGIHHALMDDRLSGPVNITAPQAVSNRELISTLGSLLGRPTVLAAPAWALRLAIGEMADAELLQGCRVAPARLSAAGYAFRQPHVQGALRHMLGLTTSTETT